MKFNVYERTTGSSWMGVEAESKQDVLCIFGNLSPICGEYALDSAAMQYSVVEADKDID